MSKRLAQTLESIQKHVQQGEFALARAQLAVVGGRRNLSRECLPALARMARLAYVPELAIRLLGPHVHPSRGRKSAATPEERGEYGMALASMGAGSEAVKILSSLNLADVPWIFFGLVLAQFRQWDWITPLPQIEEYLGREGVAELDRLQARLLEAAALIHGRGDCAGARRILDELILKTQGKDLEWLHVEALVMLAQSRFYDREAPAALATLSRLGRADETAPGVDSSFGMRVKMLRAASQLLVSCGEGANTVELQEVHAIRAELARAGLWNRVRDMDYSEHFCTKEAGIFWKLYFGTPFPAAKKKLLREAGYQEKDVPAHFDWSVGEPLSSVPLSSAKMIHVLTGENDFDPASRLKEGQLIQRTLQGLAMDFYAPVGSAGLFERIYPGENFDPVSSMLKVRQALWQLRQWLQGGGMPLQVKELDGTYFLETTEPLILRLPSILPRLSEAASVAPGLARLHSLAARAKENVGTGWFSASDFAMKLELSERSAQRYLKMGVTQGQFEVQGAGATRKYRVV